jgi:DNA-directed RNA polymerase subunit omega
MPLQNLEDLLAHVDSKYRLVIVAAKRAKQLNRGAAPLLGTRSFKPIYVALEEMASGKLQFEIEGEAELARELAEAAAKPTWFRSMVADEGELVEEEVTEEAAEAEEVEVEAPPEDLGGEPSELLPEEGIDEEEIEELDEAPGPEDEAPAEEE